MIRAHDQGRTRQSPQVVAADLLVRVKQLPDAGKFGLLVLGSTDGEFTVWEVQSSGTAVQLPFPAASLLSRGASIDLHVLDVDDSTQLVPRLRALFHLAAGQTEYVGPPYDYICLGPNNSLTLLRSDASQETPAK